MIDVFAHRGFHLTERENTIGAFRAAVALGVDGVEFDVRRTLDGVLVVHHDPAIGDLAIAQTRRAELPDYVPTLEDALESLSGVRVNAEIKNGRGAAETYDDTGELARKVLDALGAFKMTDETIISCFDFTTCAGIRMIDPDVAVAWLLWDVRVEDALTRARAHGLNAVNPHFSNVDAEVVARARELQLDINVWTVNALEDLQRMAALEVASIITDDPTLALHVVGR